MSAASAVAVVPFNIDLEFMNKETDGSGQQFGCLKFATTAFPEGYKQKGKYRVHISLDVSTSMQTDRRLELAKETVVKMVEYLTSTANENPGLQFWITLTTFSSEARMVIRNEKVNSDTLSLIISTVQRIRVENSTNFEASFLLDRDIMQEQAAKDQEDGNADTVTLHIQMTDGEITAGSKDETYLKSLLEPGVEHVFIGYGADHKADCLINLSKVNDGSSYMFLDHPTKMGAMFAQIFCPHLFTAASEVTITLTGAKFLYVEDGCEISTMFLSRVATETTKSFHILTDRDEECDDSSLSPSDSPSPSDDVMSSVYDYSASCQAVTVRVTFRSFDNQDIDQPPNFPFRTSFDVVSATTHSVEVQKEHLRWKVMILMKDAKDMKHREHEGFTKNSRFTQYDYETGQYVDPMKEEKDALIQRANELKDEVKQFGELHDIAEDEMLKDLAADLVICICAIPSYEHGLMYIYSRFRSCSDQTPSAVTDLTPLDQHVSDFVSSAACDFGDDRLFSCGGSNEHMLHRQRSGTTNAGFDILNRAMSQSPTSASSASAFHGGSQGICRSRSSYRQVSHGPSDVVGTDDDLVVIPPNDCYSYTSDAI
jgi:uncharacterized protein YegL